ncbi:16S rRNA (guanine(527)-N(7))-methyltransferase RsmG [Bacillus sp. FJAT-42376]|uniref:16S rRNA (guanine(527)-N(7))-methyltransferase RsmG n=1 Tax=Bacillus sp. FJAT-42376 TaxID=2014076 RepID=UPI000F4E7C45|nr:16S rRNA (guanine(527)-N(7))-methyltransferase RsmG [Bacillus sp. FJAT-42376]AZB44700.1 16S rRNA (guanine(527)-N(7))-methyltransferase RsmG [Bacillus sp. FJAT-42376]
MDISLFQSKLEEKGISLSPEQLSQFDTYYRLLVEWNEKMNLTSITDKEEVYLKHFYDSISAAFHFDFTKPLSICDVGAGAGFPSLPIKICFPELSVSIVDSLNKRITFLEELAKSLKLTNVHFYHDRAETFGQNKQHREKYDVVTARAVARLSVLSELCLPLAKKDGYFVALKASAAEDELQAGQKAIAVLGGKTESIHQFQLPIEESERNIVIIRKVKPTPGKYPRKPGTPNKTPIE